MGAHVQQYLFIWQQFMNRIYKENEDEFFFIQKKNYLQVVSLFMCIIEGYALI